MTAAYLYRLLCLCLAALFLLHLALTSVLALLAPSVIRIAGKMRPGRAAALLLWARLAPLSISVLIVGVMIAPSYLWLEPRGAVEPEPMAWMWLGAAALGLAFLCSSFSRAIRAIARSRRFVERCRLSARQAYLPGESRPVLVMQDGAPLVMLAGVLRSRLIVSAKVVDALPPDQLATVLQHEQAHRSSHDNLKRLLVLLAAGMLPLFRSLRRLEQSWHQVTEWAADDYAAAGDAGCSVTLASALVNVARLGNIQAGPVLVTSLMANGEDLSLRVDRLLRFVPPAQPSRLSRLLAGGAAMVLASGIMLVLAHPATLRAAHEMIEKLIQ